jgi:hypothetical protein
MHVTDSLSSDRLKAVRLRRVEGFHAVLSVISHSANDRCLMSRELRVDLCDRARNVGGFGLLKLDGTIEHAMLRVLEDKGVLRTPPIARSVKKEVDVLAREFAQTLFARPNSSLFAHVSSSKPHCPH